MTTIVDNEGIEVRPVLSCELCGKEGERIYAKLRDRGFHAPGVWDIMRCSNCGLGWLNPRPFQEEIFKLYEDYYKKYVVTRAQTHTTPRLRRKIQKSVLATHLGYNDLLYSWKTQILGRLVSKFGPVREKVERGVMYLKSVEGGKLLDVGCGTGSFLAKMRDLGWEVIGVEPDSQAADIAATKYGVSIYKMTLEEAGFAKETFDAITMNHVIEHVSDPIAILEECRRVLKPGGTIAVVTPNIKSLTHRIFRETWELLDPPRHLYLFSPSSLRACARKAGLQVLQIQTKTNWAQGAWICSRTIHRNGALPGGQPKKISTQLYIEGQLNWFLQYVLNLILKDIGEELILIAKH